jgi:hypothetical protein
MLNSDAITVPKNDSTYSNYYIQLNKQNATFVFTQRQEDTQGAAASSRTQTYTQNLREVRENAYMFAAHSATETAKYYTAVPTNVNNRHNASTSSSQVATNTQNTTNTSACSASPQQEDVNMDDNITYTTHIKYTSSSDTVNALIKKYSPTQHLQCITKMKIQNKIITMYGENLV